jgi:hypothetical protein
MLRMVEPNRRSHAKQKGAYGIQTPLLIGVFFVRGRHRGQHRPSKIGTTLARFLLAAERVEPLRAQVGERRGLARAIVLPAEQHEIDEHLAPL